ncbi:hypothetical protein [Streptomyces sp. NPDC001401]|uniref:hypothetical protein n=1 Tax=Streptomyces sp. NPDC001401 TaxID=3364570 RepID=UPI003676AD03
MGRRIDDTGGIDGHALHGIEGAAGTHPLPPGTTVHDRHWTAELRGAISCAGSFLVLLLLVDAAAGTLAPVRSALWGGLALLLFLVQVPPRVTAGEGWLAVRGPWRGHRVRTSVRTGGSAGRRMILRDSLGGRVALDPHILVANPALWHRLDTDARLSDRRGSLKEGRSALKRVSERVDHETAQAIFRVSGLED